MRDRLPIPLGVTLYTLGLVLIVGLASQTKLSRYALLRTAGE